MMNKKSASASGATAPAEAHKCNYSYYSRLIPKCKELGQNKRVLWHLCRYGSITSMEAIRRYKITRLSGRIHNLRQAGIPIETVMEPNIGQGKHARYFLKEGKSGKTDN